MNVTLNDMKAALEVLGVDGRYIKNIHVTCHKSDGPMVAVITTFAVNDEGSRYIVTDEDGQRVAATEQRVVPLGELMDVLRSFVVEVTDLGAQARAFAATK